MYAYAYAYDRKLYTPRREFAVHACPNNYLPTNQAVFYLLNTDQFVFLARSVQSCMNIALKR